MTYIRPRPILLVDVNPSLSLLGHPPDAVIGVAYSYTLVPFGGTAPYKITVVGSVPSGWSFNATTGVLSHASPSTPGALSLTLKLRDADYRERTQTFTWNVIALPLQITNNPGNYNAGVAQSFSYAASGGVAPYTWSFFGGTLPPGITLDTDGTFHGTTVNPSGTGLSGSYSYSWFAQVEDSVGTIETQFHSVTVTAVAISITNTAPDGTVGTAYTHTYTTSGGTGSKTWDVASGTVPAGLSLSIGGVLSGTPTTGATSTFTTRVTDAGGTIATLAESVTMTAIVYATWDSSKISTDSPAHATLSNGDKTTTATGGGYVWTGGTQGKTSGKWAFVVTIPSTGVNGFCGIGAAYSGTSIWGQTSGGSVFYGGGPRTTFGEGVCLFPLFNTYYYTHASSYGNTATGGTISSTQILIAPDFDAGQVHFYNYPANTLITTVSIAAMDEGLTWFPVCAAIGSPHAYTINAGQTAITLPAALVTAGFNARWASA